MLAGRLAGYAWNLVSRSQFVIEGYEWTGQECIVRYGTGVLPPPAVVPTTTSPTSTTAGPAGPPTAVVPAFTG